MIRFDLKACNLYQVLESTPGIRVEQQCQFCNFAMIRMQGLGAEHTQVLINGQPMYSGLAGVYGLQQIGTINIDRIEIVSLVTDRRDIFSDETYFG